MEGWAGLRREGWMEGKLMCVGRKKCRLQSHHQPDFNMRSIMSEQFILQTCTHTQMHTHSYTHTHIPGTQLEHSKPAVSMR